MTQVSFVMLILVCMLCCMPMTSCCYLLAPSVVALQRLLQACEDELRSLDMLINTKKSNMSANWAETWQTMCEYNYWEWLSTTMVNEIRYLGIFIVHSTKFKCSVNHAKRSFYRAANGIIGKIGRLASEEAIVQLLLQKCMPILLYGFEVCALDKRSLQSLAFTVNRFFMKLFRTSDISVVHYCQSLFAFDLTSVTLARRFAKFCQIENMKVC